jgi:hypothetical protein
LATDQITTKDKEKIDTDPAEAVHSAGQFESEQCGVINDDDDDGERTQKIEAGLAFAISKARIDFHFATVRLRPNAHQSYFGNWAENLSVICTSDEKALLDTPGEHTRLACWFRRLAETRCQKLAISTARWLGPGQERAALRVR